MNLEKYRKTLKSRIILGGLYCLLMMVPNVILNYFFGDDPFTNFIMGTMVGIEAIIIATIVSYNFALKNEESLKKLYIKEYDERRKLIKLKTGSNAIPIILGGLLIAMMIFGYFSKVVFFTLFGVLIFVAVVILSLKIYYKSKI